MKYDDAELLARVNGDKRRSLLGDEWGFDWLTAVLGIVVLIIIMVMMMLPQPKAHDGSASRVGATEACPTVQGVATSTETGR